MKNTNWEQEFEDDIKNGTFVYLEKNGVPKEDIEAFKTDCKNSIRALLTPESK
jgi:hypothetical protein